MRKRKIITKNKEIYDKLNALKYSPNVFLEDIKTTQLNKILNSINSDKLVIEMKVLDNIILLKKNSPINCDFYYRKS